MPTPNVVEILKTQRRELMAEVARLDQALKVLGNPVTPPSSGLSEEARLKLSKSMKKVWAERKKTAKATSG